MRRKNRRSLRALLALAFAALLGLSTVACEENDGLGDQLEEAGDEAEDALE